MTDKLLIAALLFIGGHICAWFQFNSQFVWESWKNKQVLSVLIYSLPVSFFFIMGTKYAVEATERLWSSRLIGYGIGIIIFSILTYFFMKESIFAPKTITCVILSIIIILIQVFWK